MRDPRQLQIIAGRVNADASIALGEGFTVVKGGTGIYNIHVSAGFRVISATFTPLEQTQFKFAIMQASNTGGAFAAVFGTTAGAAADTAFHITIIGQQV
jgi:hypothetical protein